MRPAALAVEPPVTAATHRTAAAAAAASGGAGHCCIYTAGESAAPGRVAEETSHYAEHMHQQIITCTSSSGKPGII